MINGKYLVEDNKKIKKSSWSLSSASDKSSSCDFCSSWCDCDDFGDEVAAIKPPPNTPDNSVSDTPYDDMPHKKTLDSPDQGFSQRESSSDADDEKSGFFGTVHSETYGQPMKLNRFKTSGKTTKLVNHFDTIHEENDEKDTIKIRKFARQKSRYEPFPPKNNESENQYTQKFIF